MDWLTFVSSLARALAWPIAVLAIAFGFRREIGVILSNLSKFRYKDFELQFGRKIEILKAEAEQANLPPFEAEPQRLAGHRVLEPPQELIYLEELLDIAPKAAVMEAWREIERAVRDAATRLGLPAGRTTTDVVREIKTSGRMDPGLIAILDQLRALRNSVAHVGEVELPVEGAKEYVALAFRLMGALRKIE